MSGFRGLLATLVAALLCAMAAVPERVLAQPKPEEHLTPGGIKFYHLALPGDTHHSMAMGWRDGGAYVEPGKERLPQVAASLIMQGTAALSESARVERLKDLQASLGLSASRGNVGALVAAPPADWPEVAAMLSDMLATPALPERKLKIARRNAELAWPHARENAEVLAGQAFLRLVFGDGPLLKSLIGDPAGEAAIAVADVDGWRREVLDRQPAAIVSAGPLPPDAVAREIDRMFGALPPAATARAAKPVMHAPRKFVVIERPTVQSAIIAGGPTGWIADGNAAAGAIGIRVLGGGFGSRLTKVVREGLGATYGIRASLMQVHSEAFVLSIASQVDSAKAQAALEAIRAEYARFHSGGVTAGEADPIKTRLATEMREQYRRSAGAAQNLRDVLLTLRPDLASAPIRTVPTNGRRGELEAQLTRVAAETARVLGSEPADCAESLECLRRVGAALHATLPRGCARGRRGLARRWPFEGTQRAGSVAGNRRAGALLPALRPP